MKALPFKIPKSRSGSIVLQTDDDERFYDKLHQHDEFQLTLIVSGTGTFMHGGHVESFKPGDVYLIGGGIPHLFRSDIEPRERAIARTIFFDWELFERSLGQLEEFDFFLNGKALLQRGGKALHQLREQIAVDLQFIFSSDGLERLQRFLSVINGILNSPDWQFFDWIPRKRLTEQDGRRLDQVVEFTLAHYHRQITLKEVASIANMNVTSFCRYFAKHTRRSYMTFLNEYRIQQACKLLGTTDNSVLSISLEVGFNNLSNFNRQFKNICGTSPSVYRKQFNLAFE